jgi:hypothetical protein
MSKHTATCPYCEASIAELPAHLAACGGKSPDPVTGESAPVAESSAYDITAGAMADILRARTTPGERLLLDSKDFADEHDATPNGVANALMALGERSALFTIDRRSSPYEGGRGTWIIERVEGEP